MVFTTADCAPLGNGFSTADFGLKDARKSRLPISDVEFSIFDFTYIGQLSKR